MKTEREVFDEWYGVKPKGWFEANRYNTAWKAWQAAKAQAVPEGFVLVPKEPTEKMIDAGVEETSVDWKRLVFGYKAMIEAQEQDHE